LSVLPVSVQNSIAYGRAAFRSPVTHALTGILLQKLRGASVLKIRASVLFFMEYRRCCERPVIASLFNRCNYHSCVAGMLHFATREHRLGRSRQIPSQATKNRVFCLSTKGVVPLRVHVMSCVTPPIVVFFSLESVS